MEENTSNLNEIKFLENNMNNLRWKDSSKKSEILISKKNSNHSDNNVESNYLLDEINKLKVKLEDLEKGLSEKKEIVINEDRLNNPLQLRLASSTKNKKQEVKKHFRF